VESQHRLNLILGLGMGLVLPQAALAADQAWAHGPLADAWLLMVVN
jgi:hypothetical protein